ncbi:MAG: NADH-quinone oxidoreductase subunit J [Armatimonadetes bacterium]|nr:NADH-quinone oxidoreductase subunit J [Armatimonadota bacterium]
MNPLPLPLPFPVTGNQVGFLMLAGLAMLMSIGVVVMKSPVRAAMCLVLNFFVLAFIYFTLNAQMLGITQIMVYAGAIMVLFLFVVMLLKSHAPAFNKEKIDFKPAVAVPLGLAMFVMIGSQVIWPLRSMSTIKADNSYGGPQAIAKVLFTDYVYPFEIISILLLVGVVGSVLLAKRKV